ncbi:MAG: hypothetical protein ABJA98_14320 [Acidobacteriota bacterium]
MQPLTRRTSATAFLGYFCVALLFSWPLPLHLGDAFTGGVGGDTGNYVWNLWLFRHEVIAHHRFPLFTQEILSLTPPVDLSLHNYTLFSNILAFSLIPVLGVPVTFNVVYLTVCALTGWTMFLLARNVIGRSWEAWLAGLLFAFSPYLVARSEAHFSLVAAAPLPAFLLVLIRAERLPRRREAVALGFIIAWATTCDPYYGVYCLSIAPCYLAARHLRLRIRAFAPPAPIYATVASTVAVGAAAVIAGVLLTGGGEFHLGAIRLALRTFYTPVLVLTLAVTLRIGLGLRPGLAIREHPNFGVLVRMTVWAGLTTTLLLSPLLATYLIRVADGGTVHRGILWRSSPSGIDLLALLTPNPNHRLFGTRWREWLTTRPEGYVENVAALTIVGVVTLALAVWKYRFRPPRTWLALTLFFAALALGPFVHVGGVNTFIPGPWAFLRYLPIITATRMPTRFAVVMMLGFSMLFGLALASIGRHSPPRRLQLLGLVTVLLGFELAPFPRQLHSAHIPDIYKIVANDPRPIRVLELPFGIRDGESSEGNFNASSEFYQTFHEKALVGGYLSRITSREVERQRQFEPLDTLMRLSAGGVVPSSTLEESKRQGVDFPERAKLGYVVIHADRASPALRQFAIDAFQLVKVAEDDGNELYVPQGGHLSTTIDPSLRKRGAP